MPRHWDGCATETLQEGSKFLHEPFAAASERTGGDISGCHDMPADRWLESPTSPHSQQPCGLCHNPRHLEAQVVTPRLGPSSTALTSHLLPHTGGNRKVLLGCVPIVTSSQSHGWGLQAPGLLCTYPAQRGARGCCLDWKQVGRGGPCTGSSPQDAEVGVSQAGAKVPWDSASGICSNTPWCLLGLCGLNSQLSGRFY